MGLLLWDSVCRRLPLEAGLRAAFKASASAVLRPRPYAGIARLVWEKQARIQRAATDAGCGPLTLLLCLVEAIGIAFPGQAPGMFLSVSRFGRNRSNRRQGDCRKCKASWRSTINRGWAKRVDALSSKQSVAPR
jgi:hypothetical protein